MSVQDDSELVRRCREGDGMAWDVLVGRFEPLIMAQAFRLGLSEVDAADVAQDTFMSLLDHLEQIESPERISGWLRVTARRACLQLINDRRAKTVSGSESDLLPDPRSNPRALRHLELRARVHAALERLGPPCHELLVLLYGPGALPYVEIAERLGMAIGSIGPTQARCLEKLRQLMTTSAMS